MKASLRNRDALREQFLKAKPFPFLQIDEFLSKNFVDEVAASRSCLETILKHGKTFDSVNEKRKVQITDSSLFPPAVASLNDALRSPAFLDDLAFVTGIPNLLADEELLGGGLHITGPGGRLDVHVDFNYIEQRKLHRRINLLLYLNPIWEEQWGGQLQLWDRDVQVCRQVFTPLLNRCIIFETSGISYHGVMPVTLAAPFPRVSFATYYYTREAPLNWDGNTHSTIFKARPEERLRRYILMPTERMMDRLDQGVGRIKRRLKKFTRLGR